MRAFGINIALLLYSLEIVHSFDIENNLKKTWCQLMKPSENRRTWETCNDDHSQTAHLREMIRINDLETREYNFGLVTRENDFLTALKLVQDVYIEEGYVNRETDIGPYRILKNHHHEETAVFVGKKQTQVAFTVSLFPDSAWGLPMDAIYKEELDYLRSQGRKLGEVGCLATHPEHRNGSQNILMHGNKIMFKYAMDTLELDDLVIAVHPKHALVYKEVLMFEEIDPGTVKTYPKVNNNPAIALRLDLHEAEDKFRHFYQNNSLETNLHHFIFVKNSTNIEITENHHYGPVFWDENSHYTW